MIAIMMSTFILFFAFVINIGMLVNAKINLQNAADLAAYAGAAVQARQLTQIAYLNYEMRRQYKKFLYRIYVLGNMAERSFPNFNPGGSTTPAVYSPSNNGVNYGAPTTCVIFNAQDNYCQITSLPAISIPPPSVLDAITATLSGQLTAIEAIRQQNCRAIGTTNLMLNLFWLYNADPYLTNLSGLDTMQSNTAAILQSLANGLGIVPREMLLRWRIQTLNEYVNAAPQMNISKQQVDAFLSQSDPAKNERTVQAFYSAYYTLGNHTFPGSTVSMDELIPGGSSGAQLLVLHDIKQQFDTFAIDFSLGANPNSGLSNPTSPTGSACEAMSVPVTLPQPLTFGVYKDPTVLTYYAIRLKAKARVLFSPFGDIEMKAYSAAQPFGSRIGPTDQQVSFGSGSSAAPTNLNPNSVMNLSGFIPNLAIRAQDSTSRGSGWDTTQVLGQMYESLGISTGGANSINSNMIQEAYQVAMAPSPWEGNRYTIMNDQGADAMMKNFGSDNRGAFWAPVYAPGTSFTTSGNLLTAVQTFFDDNVTGNLGANPSSAANLTSIKTTIFNNLKTYIGTSLQQGQGENGEGVNIVRITNPFYRLDGTMIPGGVFTSISPQSIKTSWNKVNRGDFQLNGRSGYSVKFVSFDSLTTNKNTTNGGNTWSNSLNMDPEGQQDIPFLKH
jgi:hypothetical protein